MIVSARLRRRWRSPCQSNSSLIDHALGRAEDAALGRQEIAGQGLAIGVDQPGLADRSGSPAAARAARRPGSGKAGPDRHPGTKMLQMSPQRFRSGSKSMISAGLRIARLLVEQHAHGRGAAAEDDELHPAIVDNRPVRQGVRELQRGMPLQHGRRLDGAAGVEANTAIIALICVQRHVPPVRAGPKVTNRQSRWPPETTPCRYPLILR